jgi:hypothetical protein
MTMPDYLLPEGVKPAPSRAARWRLPLTALALTAASIAAGWLVALAAPEAAEKKSETVEIAMTVTAETARLTQWPSTLQAKGPVGDQHEVIIGEKVFDIGLTSLHSSVRDTGEHDQLLARCDAEISLVEQTTSQASVTGAHIALVPAETSRQRTV